MGLPDSDKPPPPPRAREEDFGHKVLCQGFLFGEAPPMLKACGLVWFGGGGYMVIYIVPGQPGCMLGLRVWYGFLKGPYAFFVWSPL